MNDDMFRFVKSRLEEGEGISPDALGRLLVAARQARPVGMPVRRSYRGPRVKGAFLLAASLAMACCAWLFRTDVSARREAYVANALALLRTADGLSVDEGATLPEALLSWQDEPCRAAAN